MKTTIETISPERARRYLASNTSNRAVRAAWVQRLAGMIRDGQWKLTHQGIAFDPAGRLIDGQHRLLAIVAANKPAQLMVAREVEEDSYRHIDGGAPRTFADRLRLCNDATANKTLNAIVRMHIVITRGQSAVNVNAIEDQFLSMDAAYMAASKSWLKRVPGVTRAEVGAAMASYFQAHPKEAHEFCQQLVTGEGLYAGMPAHVLREGLLAGRAGQGSGSLAETYYKSIAAMKAHLGKRTIAALVAASSDFQGEEYARLAARRSAITKRGIRTRLVKELSK